MKRKEKGITLIALVVTIVVLLILAGVSIAMLTGDNGIITQSKNAKNNTEQAKVEEHVSVAIGSLITKFNGEINGITPKMVADQINEDENRSDVYAENETTFPTYIIFPKENRKAEANLNSGKLANEDGAIYDEDINEADIAPIDLFDYEILNDGTTGALTLNNLPTKTVKITRIKLEYCNIGGYNPDSDNEDYTDTNYEVIYKGEKISKSLIIPYQVDGKYIPNGIDGELYRVTEVSIYNYNEKCQTCIPKVEKIIYPNTVTKIFNYSIWGNTSTKEIIFSNNIQTIPSRAFESCRGLEKLMIPNNVSEIGDYAFRNCRNLKEIKVGEKNKNYDSRNNCNAIIETSSNRLIQGCNTTIIPDDVTTIGEYAFSYCEGFTSMIIPKSVTEIEKYAFWQCSNLTTINYAGSEAEWKEITLGTNALRGVTINYNYTK